MSILVWNYLTGTHLFDVNLDKKQTEGIVPKHGHGEPFDSQEKAKPYKNQPDR
jgi:hypothetical protein